MRRGVCLCWWLRGLVARVCVWREILFLHILILCGGGAHDDAWTLQAQDRNSCNVQVCAESCVRWGGGVGEGVVCQGAMSVTWPCLGTSAAGLQQQQQQCPGVWNVHREGPCSQVDHIQVAACLRGAHTVTQHTTLPHESSQLDWVVPFPLPVPLPRIIAAQVDQQTSRCLPLCCWSTQYDHDAPTAHDPLSCLCCVVHVDHRQVAACLCAAIAP
jgi:hypothetical protein